MAESFFEVLWREMTTTFPLFGSPSRGDWGAVIGRVNIGSNKQEGMTVPQPLDCYGCAVAMTTLVAIIRRKPKQSGKK
jgi:hypothetical protein